MDKFTTLIVIINSILFVLALLLCTGFWDRISVGISLRTKALFSILGLFASLSFILAELFYRNNQYSIFIIVFSSITDIFFLCYLFKMAKDKKAIDEADHYFDYNKGFNILDSIIFWFIAVVMLLTGGIKSEDDKIFSWRKIIPVVFFLFIISLVLYLVQQYLHPVILPFINK